MTHTIKSQILAVRDTGLTNMFDYHAVQRLALGRNFIELASFIETNREEYFNFILYGEQSDEIPP